MKEIKLTQGKFALVDDEDFEFLNQWKWSLKKGHGTHYAHRAIKQNNGIGRTSILMHTLIIKLHKGQNIDHINHDGLDNQRKNLRLCTPSDNSSNKRSFKNSSSKYLGVSLDSNSGKWRARLGKKGKHYNGGLFESEEMAAIAYNELAKKYHGEFANLNKI